MTVAFKGETSGLQASVGQAKNIIGSLASNPLGAVALGLGAVAVAAVGFGVASVKAAGDYDRAMRMVQALTGSNTQQMAQYDAGVKQLAVDAGVAPTALASGLYNVLSASYKGADAMKVLTLATEDSKIGMTSAAVTTDALTNVLRSFGVQSQDITRTNGEMLETVTLGKSTFEQYAQAIVKSASSAVQFHVSMETMNAAWATMTSSGIRAAQASTDFQQSLKVMYGNIGTVTASLQKNGIAFDEAKFNTMSYGDKVVYLNKALQEANEKHVKVTGVTLQAAQAISTISNHIGDYNSNLQTLSDKQAMADKTQQAWATTQGGFNQSIDRLKASISVLMINIGSALLPVLTRMVGSITPVITSIASWEARTHGIEGALGALGGVINQVAGVVNQIAGAFNAVFNPIQKVTTASKPLLDTFDRASGIFHTTASAAKPLLDTFDRAPGVIKPIADTTKPMLDTFDRATGVFQKTSGSAHGVVQAVNPFIPIFKQVASIVQGAIAVFEWVAGAVHTTIDIFNMLRPTLQAIGSFLVSNFAPVWKQLADLWKNEIVPLGKQLMAAIQPLMPLFIGLAEIVGVVLVVALGLVVGVIAAVIKGLAGFLSGLVTVIQGIVQLVTGIVQVISGIIRVIIDIVTLNFGDLGPALGQIWQGIINIFAGAWTIIAGLFLTAWYTISGIVTGFVQGIIGFFTGLYNDIVGHSIIPDMINGVISWFAQLPGRIWAFVLSLINYVRTGFLIMWNAAVTIVTQLVDSVVRWFSSLPGRVWAFVINLINYVRVGFTIMWNAAVTIVTQLVNSVVQWFSSLPGRAISAVQSLQSKLAGFFGNLASQALNWGKNIIQGIIDGIHNMLGAVGNAAQNVASTIANFLPHSPAKEGPLSKLNEFGPALVKGFSQGIVNSTPMLKAAMTAMVTPIDQYHSKSIASSSNTSNSSNTSGQQTIIFEMDSRQMARITGDRQARLVRLKMSRRSA